MAGLKAPKRTEPEPCLDCGEAKVWNPYMAVCDECFRIRWLVFAKAMGWATTRRRTR